VNKHSRYALCDLQSAAELNELRQAAERVVNPRVAQKPSLMIVRRTRNGVGKVSAKTKGLAGSVG
jgi:hypothetical protein